MPRATAKIRDHSGPSIPSHLASLDIFMIMKDFAPEMGARSFAIMKKVLYRDGFHDREASLVCAD
jgi:hypothetical protein